MQALERAGTTYSSSSASLSDPCLVQIVRCPIEVFGGFFCALFVLLEVGDGNIGLLSCIEG